ncbi:MAG TPA: ABC transporter permease [Candidatus Dormibacteraeota bacterium]|jgi:ABC-2 type transport system permease protein|nr:ABC transporter permease [Candidatus Dormibacteraeota bacterium]
MTEQTLGTQVAERRAPEAGTLVASLRAVYIIWYRDLLRFTRDRFRVLVSLVQPLLYLVIFGTGLSSSLGGGGGGAFGGAGLDYKQFLYGGVIGMTILFTSIFSAMSIVWDREFGFLKEILVAPINRSAVAVGKTLGGATQAMIQGGILLLLAPIAGVKLTVLSVLELIPLMFITAFALTAVGVALASRMRSMQGFQGMMNFLMMPMFFLSGALFPLAGLPAWMTVLTRIDPLAYGIDPIRRVILGGSGVPSQVTDKLAITVSGQPLSILEEASIVLVFGLVMLGLAIYNFRARD